MALDEPLQFFIAQIVAAAVHVHDLHKPCIRHERSRACGRGEVERFASVAHDYTESSCSTSVPGKFRSYSVTPSFITRHRNKPLPGGV